MKRFFFILFVLLHHSTIWAVPRKISICTAQIEKLAQLKLLQPKDDPAQAISLLQQFRMAKLSDRIDPKGSMPVTTSSSDLLLQLKKKKLAERIRMLEKESRGELPIEDLKAFVISGRENINDYFKFIQDRSSELNAYHPGVNFGHYFFWFLSLNMLAGIPKSILNPSNPNWKFQMIFFPIGYYFLMTDALLNRVFGNGHLLKYKLDTLWKRVNTAPEKKDWAYASFEGKIPRILARDTFITGQANPTGVRFVLAAEDVGALRRLIYVAPRTKKQMSWISMDYLLLPDAENKDWELVTVYRSDARPPEAPKTVNSKVPVAIGSAVPVVPAK